jgi:biotin-(acetyl-CoA carboxylase) ligase
MMMAARKPRTAVSLDLPPAFDLITLREAGDAFRHARALPEKAAGTLVWARRFQFAEFAVVLEPSEPLGQARLAFFAAMNALADTLAVHCPPEKPVAFAWPDTLLLDGGVLGGGRLAWSEPCREDETPDWLVFGAMLRTAGSFRTEPGEWTRGVALAEEGIWDVQPAEIVESFARHLMSALHDWAELGARHEVARWMERFHRPAGSLAKLDEAGNLCEKPGTEQGTRLLAEALARPSWLDPQTGEPWL